MELASSNLYIVFLYRAVFSLLLVEWFAYFSRTGTFTRSNCRWEMATFFMFSYLLQLIFHLPESWSESYKSVQLPGTFSQRNIIVFFPIACLLSFLRIYGANFNRKAANRAVKKSIQRSNVYFPNLLKFCYGTELMIARLRVCVCNSRIVVLRNRFVMR